MPIILSMFQQEPLPVLKNLSISEPQLITETKLVAPVVIPLKPKSRKKTFKAKRVKKVRTKSKSRYKRRAKSRAKSKAKTRTKTVRTKSTKVRSKSVKTRSKPLQKKSKSVQPKSVKIQSKPNTKVVKKTTPKQVRRVKKVVKVDNSKKAERAYRKKLSRLIAQKKTYPRKAKKMGQQGTVRVSFVILANGKIKNIRITKSSGSKSLDKAAKKLIRKISGLLPFGKSIKRKQWSFNQNIKYKLN
ncbi:MAG: energy transducer TonB [Proteobacteria bacterium]|nr:energy transducer TonB [Pseudomonadota bacterium]